MKIGLVSPYGWDVPGGVQVHIKQLAEHLIELGHEVSVIAPVSDESNVTEDFVVSAGRPMPIPFNGSVARVLFGPIAASRVRQWIEANNFDILHLHEPGIPSLSLLACWAAEGPMVGTFHASTPKLRAISAAGVFIEPVIEKLTGRIAVSEMAHQTMTSLYGTTAVVIPNGLELSQYEAKRPTMESRTANTFKIGFLGRFEEERKGFAVFLKALPSILEDFPEAVIEVAGPGEWEKFSADIPVAIRDRITFRGRLSDSEKVEYLHSLAIYVAPNTGGESFGIILTEAMAAGCAVIASDIPAFEAVLEEGKNGALFANANASDLASTINRLLGDPHELTRFSQAGVTAAAQYDWNSVATRILNVYEGAMVGHGKVTIGSDTASWKSASKRKGK